MHIMSASDMITSVRVTIPTYRRLQMTVTVIRSVMTSAPATPAIIHVNQGIASLLSGSSVYKYIYI